MDKHGIACSACFSDGSSKSKEQHNRKLSKVTCALVLVGIDLIIFRVAYMVLYFGFVTKALVC